MAVITPAGRLDFNWVPKDKSSGMNKTASSNNDETQETSDKDLMYSLAKKVIEAQFEEESEAEETSNVDAKQVVEELVDKAESAEKVEEAVEEAVEKVEEAVEGVKSALTGDEAPAEESFEIEEVTLDVEDGSEPEIEEVTLEVSDEETGDEEVVDVEDVSDGTSEVEEDEVAEIEIVDEDSVEEKTEDTPEEEGGEDIIQKSKEDCEASSELSEELQKEAGANDFMKIGKISPTTRKKVMKFWKDDLGYPSDYVKLMTTNYEK